MNNDPNNKSCHGEGCCCAICCTLNFSCSPSQSPEKKSDDFPTTYSSFNDQDFSSGYTAPIGQSMPADDNQRITTSLEKNANCCGGACTCHCCDETEEQKKSSTSISTSVSADKCCAHGCGCYAGFFYCNVNPDSNPKPGCNVESEKCGKDFWEIVGCCLKIFSR